MIYLLSFPDSIPHQYNAWPVTQFVSSYLSSGIQEPQFVPAWQYLPIDSTLLHYDLFWC